MKEGIKAATQDAVARILDEIRKQRQAAGVSAAEAAQWAGVSEEVYLRMERGEEEMPLDAYYGIAQRLGINPAELMQKSMKPRRLH